ncbi:MAG: hypothetical protein HGGPFJEG_02676 [Ignavibacteria bacterium]|nr:hypothetical protein [Ignavibacteria bacterium]
MRIRHILLWFPMIAIAFGNATLRELVFIKLFSEFRAKQLSNVTLIILCSIYVWFVYKALDIQNTKEAFQIGFVWMLLTVVFEFSLGFLTNKTWEYLLQDYNIFAGHLWLVFLAALFLLPYICHSIRKCSGRKN